LNFLVFYLFVGPGWNFVDCSNRFRPCEGSALSTMKCFLSSPTKNIYIEAFLRTNFINHFRTKFIEHFRIKFIKHLRTNCTTSFRTKSVISKNQIVFCISFTMHVVNSCLSEFLSDHKNVNVTQQNREKT
jgi:hypothetical protein